MLPRVSVQTKLALALVAFLTTRAAFGQNDDSARDAARGHYKQGLAFVAEGQFDQALVEFRSAYRASPQFAVLYNIGQACIALDRPIEAVSALEQYLSEGKAEIPAERRDQVERQLATLKAGTAEIAVVTSAPGSGIEIDGREIGRAPLEAPARVIPGDHVISVRAEDGSKLSRRVTLRAGDRLDLRLDPPTPAAMPAKATGTLAITCHDEVRVWIDGTRVLSSLSAPEVSLEAGQHRIALLVAGRRSAEQRIDIQRGSTVTVDCAEFLARPEAAPRPQSSGTVSTVGYVVGGVGAALGVAAFGHYLWNLGRYEEWKETNEALEGDEAAADYTERQTENNELGSSIDRASRVTVTLAVGGGALLATGVTLVVFDHGGSRPSATGKTGLAVSIAGVW